MVGYHLLTEAQSIQLGVWREGGTVSPPTPPPPQQVQDSALVRAGIF